MEFNLFNVLLTFTVNAVADRAPVFVVSPRNHPDENPGGATSGFD